MMNLKKDIIYFIGFILTCLVGWSIGVASLKFSSLWIQICFDILALTTGFAYAVLANKVVDYFE